jgi:hypothetical protein
MKEKNGLNSRLRNKGTHCNSFYQRQNMNSEALVRQRTILTERPPLVGEVSANFSG